MLDIDPFDGRTLKRQSWAFLNLIGEDRVETWTPVLTFATPGDLSVAYTVQQGSWQRLGRLIAWDFSIVTSTFTHTTAAGDLRITGLPFTCDNVTGRIPQGSGAWQGITKANYSQVMFDVNPGTAYISPSICGSAQSWVTVTKADMPTAGTVKLVANGIYRTGTA